MNSKPPKILFVDDHQDTLDLFAIALSQENYEVVTALSIEQALQETTAEHFDLMIFDSWVGDGSGVDLCRSIRKQDTMTPILFCSGLAAEKYRQEALDAGAQDYLIKPVNIAELYAMVSKLISPTSQQAFKGDKRIHKSSGDLLTAHS